MLLPHSNISASSRLAAALITLEGQEGAARMHQGSKITTQSLSLGKNLCENVNVDE